jgi:hypothetical protein
MGRYRPPPSPPPTPLHHDDGPVQDVSRLLDVCRQSIVFESVADLATCLRAIRADREACLLRVKNRLDPGYASGASAGYRDVGLNLRLDTLWTRDMGVDGHVCEVQLLLLPFAQIKVSSRPPTCPERSRVRVRVRKSDR